MQERFRGPVVVGKVDSKQIEALSSSPMGTPTISSDGRSDTAAGASPRFVFNISMNRNAFGDTDGKILQRRASMMYHLEDTDGALLDGAVITAAESGNTSGLTAAGVVIPNSTVAGGFGVGRILCSSSGVCTLALSTSSGGGTTGVLVLTMPNGLIAQSSQVAFSSA